MRLPLLLAYVITALTVAGLHDLPVLSGDAHLVAMAPLHQDVVRADLADDDGGDDPVVIDFDDDLMPTPGVAHLAWLRPAGTLAPRDEAAPPSMPRDPLFRPPRARA